MHPPVALLLHPAARIALSEFTVHPSTVIGLVGLGALYHWRASRRQILPFGSAQDDGEKQILRSAQDDKRGSAQDDKRGSAQDDSEKQILRSAQDDKRGSAQDDKRGSAQDDKRGSAQDDSGVVADKGCHPERSEGSASPSPSTAQRATFYAGLVLIFFSLNGWLHDLSDYYLFSAHMVQHLLLTLVAPPLLIMGIPGWMLRPALRWPGVGALARRLTTAPMCFAIFTVVLAVWHLPPVYGLAMVYHDIHIVQHLFFMVAATLMWWPVLSPLPELPRISYPAQMLYLFLLSIPMSLIAICIGYSDHILYPAYSSAPRIWGITPLQDQLIGALIMWVPGGLFFFVIISVVFFRWQRIDGEDSTASAQVGWQVAPR